MKKNYLYYFWFFLMLSSHSIFPLSPLKPDIPVQHLGRYHAAKAYAHLWFEGLSPQKDPLNALWQHHFQKNDLSNKKLFFLIKNPNLRKSLGLSPKQNKISYDGIFQFICETENAAINLLKPILICESLKNDKGQSRIEIFSNLVTRFEGDDLVLISTSNQFPWNLLKPKTVIKRLAKSQKKSLLKTHQKLSDDTLELLRLIDHYQAPTFCVLPGPKGNWFSLEELKTQEKNFTLYPKTLFDEIRNTYLILDRAFKNSLKTEDLEERLSSLLKEGYFAIEGKKIQEAHFKRITYPTWLQLNAETSLFSFPFVEVSLILYLVSLLLISIQRINPSLIAMSFGFFTQTILLFLRSFILGRPPVSNMYETMLFVPWVTVASSFILYIKSRFSPILIGANLGATVLLGILLIGKMHQKLENVPAVLDSQYWLMIHVLMVVGSYGFFILSGILSHLYFLTTWKVALSKAIIQTIYLGTTFLIAGTLLGGVWAAQSWGRFWDWDPKESWAFVSCCTYLILIHLYRFKQISSNGLAIGSIIGMLVISFTWYGVNYILGTGLHSYGFGHGGTFYYGIYTLLEAVFLILVYNLLTKRQIGNLRNSPYAKIGNEEADLLN